MSDLLSEMAAIMRSEVDTLNAIAQNSANVNTHGYRSQRSARVDHAFAQSINANNSQILKFDNSNGNLQVTGVSSDLAIVGEAWFRISHPSGTAFTRNGNFHISAEGTLVTRQGYEVIGESGAIRNFSTNSEVDSTGLITHSDGTQDRLLIFNIDTSSSMKSIGEGFYTSENIIDGENGSRIVQNALEGSNVDLAEDMVRIMETTRHIESLQRAMSSYDDLLDTGINQIGK